VRDKTWPFYPGYLFFKFAEPSCFDVEIDPIN